MKNREIEVIILERIKEKNNKFEVYPTSDFKYNRKLKIPRVVSQTINNQVMHHCENEIEIDDDYAGYEEISNHKHYIQLTFVLDKDTSFNDVEEIRQMLKHKVGSRYYFALNGINLIIQKVGEIKDISEHTPSTFLERYSIDIEVSSVEIYTEKVEKIKKVDFRILRRK